MASNEGEVKKEEEIQLERTASADEAAKVRLKPSAMGWFGFVYSMWCTWTNWLVLLILPGRRMRFEEIQKRIAAKSEKQRIEVGKSEEAKAEMCSLRVKVLSATALPKMDYFGSADPYVVVSVGTKQKSTRILYNTLEPEWNDEVVFELRKDSKVNLCFTVMDSNVRQDEVIGKVIIRVQEVFYQNRLFSEFAILDKAKKPVKNKEGKPAYLKLAISYTKGGSLGDIDWLNGCIAKTFHCFHDLVSLRVAAEMKQTFAERNAKSATYQLSLEQCDLGASAPWLMDLRVLPTLSNNTIQVRCRWRWQADGQAKFRINVKSGPLSFTVTVNDLDVEFPAWMEMQLEDSPPYLRRSSMAATEDPEVKFRVAFLGVTATSVPGIAGVIQSVFQKTLSRKLVLPNMIQKQFGEVVERPEEEDRRREVKGVLSLRVYEAEGLGSYPPRTGVWVYVCLKVTPEAGNRVSGRSEGGFAAVGGERKEEKRTQKSTFPGPSWEEDMELDVRDEERSVLCLEVRVEKAKQPLVSSLHIPIASLNPSAGWREAWFQLEGESGRIRIGIEYTRMMDRIAGSDANGGHAGASVMKEASDASKYSNWMGGAGSGYQYDDDDDDDDVEGKQKGDAAARVGGAKEGVKRAVSKIGRAHV